MQPTWAGGRIAYLMATAGRYLPEAYQVLLIGSVATKATRELVRGRGSQARAKERAKANPSPSEPPQWPTHRAEPLGLEWAWGRWLFSLGSLVFWF